MEGGEEGRGWHHGNGWVSMSRIVFLRDTQSRFVSVGFDGVFGHPCVADLMDDQKRYASV